MTPPPVFPRRMRFAQLGATLSMLGLLGVGSAVAEPVVFAAASTRAALEAALDAGGQVAVVSYGASGTIARQIAQGAPADVFVSANPKWMQYLVEEGLVQAEAVQVLISNRLALIAPSGTPSVELSPDALADRLSGEFFAVADPDVAPVGQYGREALVTLDLWPSVAPSLLPTRNTIATVAAVASGEAALGLVYRSDATGVDGISVAAEIPAESHPPIHYLIAPLSQGDDPQGAAALIGYLTGPEGEAGFESFGFEAIGEGGS
ncbi:molybdate ABC transporter substrate-binding protein [Tropicimonas isoalkanivorans]|uniref:Molybdate transport system substrate-binding protein n=1 Tax=Tropicimonas isoalkanivorans TaxID=441112 RepID=A0A1I1H624_9RHOB|nr:molybdate ABC transporter substrate-binding protein [Tropicimonas isoalkanivorans]SFC19639.1 molybdate transport system substrate-binding protein [Tropicimonas isoalkanivorans]